MTLKLKTETDHETALISYSTADGRLIFATSELFGVAVDVSIHDMQALMEKGNRFAEVEDSTCAIGFQIGTFGHDPLYNLALGEADQMRDVVLQYGMPKAIEIWNKRNGR